MKVALLQLNPSTNPDNNLKRAESAMNQAKKKGADLVLFPELWTTGYEEFPKSKKDQETCKEKSLNKKSKLYAEYLSLFKKIKIAGVFTFLESNKKKTKFYNSAVLINNEGKELMRYRKTHLVANGWERNLQPGNRFPVKQLKIGNSSVKIGVMICYDREFPEVARILMLKGAEIILVPNACLIESNRLAQLQTRAFENMCGVAMTNYSGKKFKGKSVAFDGMRIKGKNYDPLLALGKDKEEIIIVNFDLKALNAYRKKEIWGDSYRRPKLYKKLCKNLYKKPFVRKDSLR